MHGRDPTACAYRARRSNGVRQPHDVGQLVRGRLVVSQPLRHVVPRITVKEHDGQVLQRKAALSVKGLKAIFGGLQRRANAVLVASFRLKQCCSNIVSLFPFQSQSQQAACTVAYEPVAAQAALPLSRSVAVS